MKLCAALLSFSISAPAILAQQQPPPPPPQTARQALIEMITGGPKAISKHLTVEVQQLLAKAGPKGAMVLAPFDGLRSELGTNAQTFDSGQVLLVVNQNGEHAKLEIRVENDDLSGDEDTLTLSPHVIRESSDQTPEEWEAFLSSFTVNLKRQAGIWRLNKIGVGLELQIGNPEVVKATFLREPPQRTPAASSASPEMQSEPQEPSHSAFQIVNLLAYYEYAYAHQHPETGFSCSVADVAQAGGALEFSNGTYKGYKLSLTGCQGKPSGSFQVVVEPLAAGSGKAFCTDATRNIRVADDGRGSTCLVSGRLFEGEGEGDSVGMRVIAPAAAPSKE